MKLTYLKQGAEPNGSAGDQYAGLDRFGRVVDQRWLKGGIGAELERLQYGYDQASNRLYRKNLVASAGGRDELYGYDGLNQLELLQRGTLNSARTGLTGIPVWEEDFAFDPSGNWEHYLTKANGSPTLDQSRAHSKVNALTKLDNAATLLGYDAAGNMTKAPQPGNSNWTPSQ